MRQIAWSKWKQRTHSAFLLNFRLSGKRWQMKGF
jgi:hypothetical protein